MSSLIINAFLAVILMIMLCTRTGLCILLVSPAWSMGWDVVFYFVDRDYPGKVVASAFVVVAALFAVYARVLWCMFDTAPQHDDRISAGPSASIDNGKFSSSARVSSLVLQNVFPSDKSSTLVELTKDVEMLAPLNERVVEASTSGAGGSAAGTFTRHVPTSAHTCGSVLVTNPNVFSADDDVVFGGMSPEDWAKLDEEVEAYEYERVDKMIANWLADMDNRPAYQAAAASDESIVAVTSACAEYGDDTSEVVTVASACCSHSDAGSDNSMPVNFNDQVLDAPASDSCEGCPAAAEFGSFAAPSDVVSLDASLDFSFLDTAVASAAP
ncbi:hypothetical protein, partial, partial [Parasitella parasitica]